MLALWLTLKFLRILVEAPDMRNIWLSCFLFGCLLGVQAWGQGKPVAAPTEKTPAPDVDDDDKPVPPPPSAANVAPDAAVMTIKGLCPKASSKPGELSGPGCETVITRAEFEKIARAIQPSLSPVVKKQLISLYPRLLIMSREAEARGLDKEEYFQQMFDFARMQILTQQLTHRVQEEAGQVPEKDITDYYEKNPEGFKEYSLERIYIPRMKQMPPPPAKLSEEAEKDRQKNAEDEMTKLAGTLRSRAANGESFDALQKEAYQSAGMKSNPPNAAMGKMRRTGLPPGHDSVFTLKVGEVSQVMNDAGGHYIYKLDSASMETLDEVKPEIHNMLKSQRLHALMEKIQGPFSTELNDSYFGTVSGSAPANAPAGAGSKPGSAPANPGSPK
jgi:hypothetical protein